MYFSTLALICRAAATTREYEMPLRHARERRLWTLARDVRCRMVPWWALCRARGAASRCRARAGRHTDRVQGGGPRQQPRAAPHVSRARPLAARKAKAIASHGTAARPRPQWCQHFPLKSGDPRGQIMDILGHAVPVACVGHAPCGPGHGRAQAVAGGGSGAGAAQRGVRYFACHPLFRTPCAVWALAPRLPVKTYRYAP